MTDQPQHRIVGLVVLGLAVYLLICALTVRTIPLYNRWMLGVCAVIFCLAGLQLLTAAKGRMSYFMAGAVCSLFSVAGFYIAFSGERLRGGMPFLPIALNQAIGHVLFGFGAIITTALAAYFIIKAVKPGKGG